LLLRILADIRAARPLWILRTGAVKNIEDRSAKKSTGNADRLRGADTTQNGVRRVNDFQQTIRFASNAIGRGDSRQHRLLITLHRTGAIRVSSGMKPQGPQFDLESDIGGNLIAPSGPSNFFSLYFIRRAGYPSADIMTVRFSGVLLHLSVMNHPEYESK